MGTITSITVDDLANVVGQFLDAISMA
jgi:hypothetical protein